MDSQETLYRIIKALDESTKIAIVPSKVAGIDALAAALGLYLALKQKDKKVSLVYPGIIPDDFAEYIRKEEVISDPSLRDLVVAIDYSQTPASKVSYSTANDVLYLRISPINSDFDSRRVTGSVEGFNFDLVITIGAQVPEDFGQTLTHLEDEFRNSLIINLDNTDRNQRWGNINIVDVSAHCLSLLALNNIVKWGLNIDSKAAKVLLKGISYSPVN